jgi:hypothetical protein
MRTNNKSIPEPLYTAAGAPAVRVNHELQLRRSVLTCMLWEDSFYESGEAIAKRIADIVAKLPFQVVADLAIEAREKMHLRHVPLLLTRELLRTHKGRQMGDLIARVIQRADECAELLAIYWKDNPKSPLTAQLKVGLARAIKKFSAFDLAKWNRDADVRLRDVLFLAHARPMNDLQAQTFKQLAEGTLETPDTWEVSLSGGKEKKETWTRLMEENKLGGLAFLRNLRNMHDAGVEKYRVIDYAQHVNLSRVLPFRFVAAARAVPMWEDICDAMFLRCAEQAPKLPGKTILIVDTSGSMYRTGNISAKSDMRRIEAAGALAAIAREVCEDPRIYATAGNDARRVHATMEMPARRGMALVDLVANNGLAGKIGGGGIFLHQCLTWVRDREKTADRIIVITDEADCDLARKASEAPAFATHNYLINISVERNGIGYKPNWTHIDGWSEAVINYIMACENVDDSNQSQQAA